MWNTSNNQSHQPLSGVETVYGQEGALVDESRLNRSPRRWRIFRRHQDAGTRIASLYSRLFLGGAGALLLFIGASVLFQPESFAAGNGITLGNNPSLLSEVRAPGGMLFVSSLLLILGACHERYLSTALGLAALIYGSYGAGRLVAVAADGLPSSALTVAMVVELVIGAISLAAFLRLGRKAVGRA